MNLRAITLLLVSVASAACVHTKVITTTTHSLHGVVQSLDPSSKTATIKHDDIPGFMSAMTMEYPVKDAAAFARLRVGETIDATVFVQDSDFWLGKIQEGK